MGFSEFDRPPHSEKKSSEEIHQYGEISMSFLFGGTLLPIDLNREQIYLSLYKKLSELSFQTYTVQHPEFNEVILVGQPLDGLSINYLMFASAPDRNMFGLDTNDISNDWTDLYSSDPKQQERLAGHRRIPGWTHFENEREMLLTAIQSQADTDPTLKITPIIRFKVFPDGRKEWVWDTSDIPAEILNGVDSSRLSPLSGLAFASAYSPDRTIQFPKRAGTDPANSFKERTQTIGSTQILPLLAATVEPGYEKYFPQIPSIFETILMNQLSVYLSEGIIAEFEVPEALKIVPRQIRPYKSMIEDQPYDFDMPYPIVGISEAKKAAFYEKTFKYFKDLEENSEPLFKEKKKFPPKNKLIFSDYPSKEKYPPLEPLSYQKYLKLLVEPEGEIIWPENMYESSPFPVLPAIGLFALFDLIHEIKLKDSKATEELKNLTLHLFFEKKVSIEAIGEMVAYFNDSGESLE